MVEWHGYKKEFSQGKVWFDVGCYVGFSNLTAKLVSGLKNGANIDKSDWTFETHDGIKIIVPHDLASRGFHDSMTLLDRPLECGDWIVAEDKFCGKVSEVRGDDVFVEMSGDLKLYKRNDVTRIKPPESATSA